jgi:Zn-dependent protease
MLSLSLAILNLLPLPYLDGAHILEAGLDYWYPNSRKAASTDIEEFEGEPLQSPRVDPAVVTKRRRIEQAILYGSSGLTATAFGGGLVMTALTALIGSDVSK